MNKHTPGPWEVVGVAITAEHRSTEVARVSDYDTPTPRQAANARLIAAAPELLAALQNVRDAHRTGHNADEAWRWVDDAITKATGEAA